LRKELTQAQAKARRLDEIACRVAFTLFAIAIVVALLAR